MTVLAASDVQARLSTKAYQRLFAINGGTTIDATFLALVVSEANSVGDTLTRAAFPDGFEGTGGTVDVAIVGAYCDIALEIAASRHLTANDASGYAFAGKRAREYLKSLNRDRDARPATSAAGRARPRAENSNVTDADGNPTNPYTRAADLKDNSGF